ncbi:hypothetical protein BDV93DRAFT_528698 [Ceratobasidium sp. AG-I]|nr:hypothetical protein BDV93DRAFT_528698 [Ceratobasidium sp. AG-I]
MDYQDDRTLTPQIEMQSSQGEGNAMHTASTDPSDADRARSSLSSEDKAELEAGLEPTTDEPSSSTLGEKQQIDASLQSKRYRNRSLEDVPIARLFPELLIRIFITITATDKIASGRGRVSKCELSAPLLASVCYYWRQLALRTCQLWTHTEICVARFPIDSRLSLTKLWLERAGKALLDIHVHSGQVRHIGKNSPYLTLLSERVAQFRSLQVASYAGDFLISTVSLWLNCNTSRPLGALVLKRRLGYSSIFGSSALDGYGAKKLPLVPSPLLANVRTLRLRGSYLDWDLIIFRGLIELELRDIFHKTGPTSEQLSQVLSACPELRSLYVHNLEIWEGESPSPGGSPVKLGKLDTITLGHLPGRGTKQLLNLLESVSPTLCLRLRGVLHFRPDAIEAVINFCNRAKLPKLCFGPWEERAEPAAKIVVKIPSLETLVLDSIDLTEGFFSIISDSLDTTSSPMSPIELPSSDKSNLQNLYLRRCEVIPSKLKELVRDGSIKHLEIWCCRSSGRDVETKDPETPLYDVELTVELREWLRKNVLSFHFTVI